MCSSDLQRQAVTGGVLNLKPLSVEGMRGALASINANFPVKEMEVLQFGGKPYYIAYQAPSASEVAQWFTRSVTDFISPAIEHEHLIVSASGPAQNAFARFPDDGLEQMARAAMPNSHATEVQWLTQYDDYYYSTLSSFDLGIIKDVRSLPVLRVKFDDPKQTILYLNPAHGQMVKYDADDKVNRWAYYGLHGLDFAFIFKNRPLWDVIAMILLAGGTLLSVTTLAPMYRRLKRHVLRVWDGITGQRRPAPLSAPQTTMKGNLGD